MPLIQLKDVCLRYHSHRLLDGANLQVEAGERVCLLGRNGAGKTSLLRVIAGEESPDSGEVIRQSHLRLRWLPQEIPAGVQGTVREVVEAGLDPTRHEEPWETDVRVDDLLAAMGLGAETAFDSLSGGWKRRVLLARALAGEPDLLLLDEPTNHLDIAAIVWLEQFLIGLKSGLLFVTHDRAFLRRTATRIVELDRGNLTSWSCDYDTFLTRKAAALEAEETQRAAFDKKLAQEEAWLRQGVKARRTRNEGRVRALEQLRQIRKARRERPGTARMEIQQGTTSGQKVIEVDTISFGYGSHPIVRDFSTILWRGDKVGLVGPNGVGKSTLLNLLLGRLNPQSGNIRHGTNLQVVYLDQMRDQIHEEKTLAQNVAGSADTVQFADRTMHIHGYLRQFLFEPEQVRAPAKWLSGGERNRLLLAKLFLQPANVLVLDEPTNDLDLETLELLEDLLVNYSGTLLVVSHDRDFLDHVATTLFVFEGDGVIREVNGGYSDWEQWKARSEPAPVTAPIRSEDEREKPAPSSSQAKESKKTFLNRERKELTELPARIEALEEAHADLISKMADPLLAAKNPETAAALSRRLDEMEREIDQAYTRWEELEAKRIAADGSS